VLLSSRTPLAISSSSATSGMNWMILPSCFWKKRASSLQEAAGLSSSGEPMSRIRQAPWRPSDWSRRHGCRAANGWWGGPPDNRSWTVQLLGDGSGRSQWSHFAAYCLTAARIS
jgi:hypothetical protein